MSGRIGNRTTLAAAVAGLVIGGIVTLTAEPTPAPDAAPAPRVAQAVVGVGERADEVAVVARTAVAPRVARRVVTSVRAVTAPRPAVVAASVQDVGRLISDLRSSDATERAYAACAIDDLDDVEAVRRARTGLFALLSDGTPVESKLCRDWEGRWDGARESSPGREAAIALEALGTEALDPLVDVLEGPDAVGRENAALAIGLIESETSIDPLVRALDDEDVPAVRARVAWALGMIESSAAVPALSEAMSDPEAAVRAQAAWGLGMIESSEGVRALRRGVDDRDSEVRAQTAWALGMIESDAGVDPLLRLLRDEAAGVRSQAAWGLGMVESTRGTAGLIDALEDPNPEVRSQAAWGLGMIEDPAAVDGLLDALEDEDERVQEQAMWALAQVIRGGDIGNLDRSDLADRLRRALGRDPIG